MSINFRPEIGDDNPVVAMIEFDGTVFVATSLRVYRLNAKTDRFEPVMFVSQPEGMLVECPSPSA